MPWSTPTLAAVRQNNRDYITARLRQPLIPNDYPRFLADANAGNAHLNLQYLDWQALQLLPDTAEQQFLEKWANIFLVNADGSLGRKVATFSAGSMTINGTVAGTVLPAGATLTALSGSSSLTFQTTAQTTLAVGPTPIPIRALVAGAASNLAAGTALSLSVAINGVDAPSAVVATLVGGADEETDDELRARVLFRIRKPPMGGDADDYIFWATQVPGVTRAWCSPLEMGAGTVTLRFMMDDLRSTADPTTSGLPLASDIATVAAYIETLRPVTADVFVQAPIPEPIPFTITNLSRSTAAIQAAISTSTAAAIARRARPAYAQNGVGQSAQTIFAAWISDAILAAAGVVSFDLQMADHVMPTKGSLAVPGAITYA